MEKKNEDMWMHRSLKMRCRTCMYWVAKQPVDNPEAKEPCLGRCRRNAPTTKGWPALFATDWCGEHKLDENKI